MMLTTQQINEVNRKHSKPKTGLSFNTKQLTKVDYIRHGKRWDKFSVKNNKTFWGEMSHFRSMAGDVNGRFDGIINAWKDEPCFIVGGSDALKGFDLNLFKGFHTIGINHMIDYWTGFEWFIHIDHSDSLIGRLKEIDFKGKIFESTNCGISGFQSAIRFKQLSDFRTLNISDGLFGRTTGISAMHLALIAGANPIYMCGLDTPVETEDRIKQDGKGAHHFKEDYQTEVKKPVIMTYDYLQKYNRSMKDWKKFVNYKDRFINVCDNPLSTSINEGDVFKVIKLNELKEHIEKLKINNKKKENTICHVTNFENIDDMNDISRQLFELTEGKHIRAHIFNKNLPEADIYLLECILRDKDLFFNFKAPEGKKLISLMHSENCHSKYSTRTVVLTESQKIPNAVVIPCAVDVSKYNIPIDYSNKNYGRLTVSSSGKIHRGFNNVVNNVKLKIPESQCTLISYNSKEQNQNIKYITDIQRHEEDKRIKALSELSVFADMHGDYKETFSLCLLEAMAAGLAIILYSKVEQKAMLEVLGGCGIVCHSEAEFEAKLIELVKNTEMKKELGLKAKERAKLFSIENMISKWNNLFKEVIK